MRFSCENCQAKYQVADEKVAGKTIRMKCRKCGNSIEVKPVQAAEPSTFAADLGATEQHPIAPPPETRLGEGIAAHSLASPSFPGPEAGPASRLPFDSSPGFDRAPESLRLALGAEASDLPAHFWYVAIGGAPVGPIALAEVVAKAREGLVNDRSLAWREGLAEWQPVAQLPELLEAIGPALQAAPAPRSAAFPPAPATVVPGVASPVVAPAAPLAPAAPAAPPSPAKKEAPHAATLAAQPISNELRAILDSSPAIVVPPVEEAFAPTKGTVPETAPSPRDEFASSPASVRAAPPAAATRKGPIVVGVIAGLVVGFAAGRLSAPAPVVTEAPAANSMQTAPSAAATDDKLEEVPTPPPAAAAEDPRAAAKVAPRLAPAPRAAAPAPAAPAPAARPVTAAPPPPPMPSFGGGGGASLTEGQIAGVLAQRKIQLRRACWERIENHEAAVKVQATINIEGTGRVSSVEAQGSDAAVAACIRQQIKEWTFPATGAPTTATLPFSFVSQ